MAKRTNARGPFDCRIGVGHDYKPKRAHDPGHTKLFLYFDGRDGSKNFSEEYELTIEEAVEIVSKWGSSPIIRQAINERLTTLSLSAKPIK